MSRALAPSFDFCQFQRFVNSIGGSEEYPAYHPPSIRQHGERLIQYGFKSGPLPDAPGVYAISTLQLRFTDGDFHAVGSEHVLYIGSSKNIRQRLLCNHPWYHPIHDRFDLLERVVIVRHRITMDYAWEEKSLIRNVRPLLNIQHNG